MRYFTLFFLCQFFKTGCVVYTSSTPRFGLATFRVLSSYIWPVATILDSAGLTHDLYTFFMRFILFKVFKNSMLLTSESVKLAQTNERANRLHISKALKLRVSKT